MADPSPAPVADRDWTAEVTDRIELVVGTVRDKTAVPATKVAETTGWWQHFSPWSRSFHRCCCSSGCCTCTFQSIRSPVASGSPTPSPQQYFSALERFSGGCGNQGKAEVAVK
jgi:hypothetical protein